MHRLPHDPDTEARIRDEILVDAHEEEVPMAWQQHVQDTVHFPFEAHLAVDRKLAGTQTIPVQIIDLHPNAKEAYDSLWLLACLPEQNLHVAVRPEDLRQLEALEETDESTFQTLHDWCYWVQHMT